MEASKGEIICSGKQERAKGMKGRIEGSREGYNKEEKKLREI